MSFIKKTDGEIEVICGPMFAGKSDELLRRLNKLSYTNIEYVIFKPKLDTRTESIVKTRNGFSKPAINVLNGNDILKFLRNSLTKFKVVAIDEVQFFSEEIVKVVEILADSGYHVIVAGLDKDFKNQPFGSIPLLLTKAEKITKLTAICTKCFCEATHTQRLVNEKPANWNSPVVLVGDKESYTARCRHCHRIPGKPMDEEEQEFSKFVKLRNKEKTTT
ncbi:MAG: thymidine kinase [Mycoplasma sp.]